MKTGHTSISLEHVKEIEELSLLLNTVKQEIRFDVK